MKGGRTINLLKAAVTQIDISQVETLEAFITQIDNYVENAKNNGAGIILLPQYTGVLLKVLKTGRETFEAFIGDLEENDHNVFLELFTEMATKHDIYIGCGTDFEKEKDRVYNTGYVIAHDGKILLKQRQTHLSRTERDLGLARGRTIDAIETDLGKLGLVIGTDKYYPEVSRIAALQGADILLNPNGGFLPYNPFRQIGGMWQEVQQNQVLGMESAFIGKLMDQTLDGRACVYAPCEMTKGYTGFVTSLSKETELFIAPMSIEALKEPREAFPIFQHFNIELYKAYFPKIYKQVR